MERDFATMTVAHFTAIPNKKAGREARLFHVSH